MCARSKSTGSARPDSSGSCRNVVAANNAANHGTRAYRTFSPAPLIHGPRGWPIALAETGELSYDKC